MASSGDTNDPSSKKLKMISHPACSESTHKEANVHSNVEGSSSSPINVDASQPTSTSPPNTPIEQTPNYSVGKPSTKKLSKDDPIKISDESEDEQPLKFMAPECVTSNIMAAFSEKVIPDRTQLEASQLQIFRDLQTFRINRKDLETLEPKVYVNDNIVNSSLSIYQRRSELTEGAPRCLTFSTFFLIATQEDSIPQLPFEAKNFDRLVFPIHRVNHWLLVVVDNQNQKIYSVDSLSPHHPAPETEQVRISLTDFYKKNQSKEADRLNTFQCVSVDIPRQRNLFDCAPAMLKAAGHFYDGATKLPKNLDSPSYEDFRETIKTTLTGCGEVLVPGTAPARQRRKRKHHQSVAASSTPDDVICLELT
ncbi:Ulp1 family isopeptidase [Parendozoicomonas sp. Alg238-R29]|uniref:Ulp1 family isopeptidase n=1 Tax=Parendozoicomonas sp. Alg238-R29 TaxID=2993446 RepID=UPI00248F34D5|nr:Ulp1 family isopeptidase [Parendozoicomonas sp. Alg238-R29]